MRLTDILFNDARQQYTFYRVEGWYDEH